MNKKLKLLEFNDLMNPSPPKERKRSKKLYYSFDSRFWMFMFEKQLPVFFDTIFGEVSGFVYGFGYDASHIYKANDIERIHIANAPNDGDAIHINNVTTVYVMDVKSYVTAGTSLYKHRSALKAVLYGD